MELFGARLGSFRLGFPQLSLCLFLLDKGTQTWQSEPETASAGLMGPTELALITFLLVCRPLLLKPKQGKHSN